jgi:long-chain-alcohol oxidase
MFLRRGPLSRAVPGERTYFLPMAMSRLQHDRRALRVFAALGRGALGDAYTPEVPGWMGHVIDQLPAPDRKSLASITRALDTRSGALALTGRRIPVSWLSASEAEALLIRWKASRSPIARRLAGVFTSLPALAAYSHPGPAWERIGYPGPMGPPPDVPKRLKPITLEANESMSCDVVVVGSGAGGGCVAARLAEAGLDVIVVEKGGYLSESDFTHIEAEASRSMYLYGGALATTDLGVRIISGSTLGGGTVVNFTTSFKTPDFVLEEWARASGIKAFVGDEFQESLDTVAQRLNVNVDSSAAGRRDELMEEGLKKLGWHVDGMPRAVRGCTQDEACGYCGFGCRVAAKQSTMRTYLEDAAAAGARLIVGADVRRVLVKDGRATGIRATSGHHELVVNARTVVVAAGSIETPALLLRSGLGGQVGRNLHLHPGTAPLGIFDDDVGLWEGTLQARFSKEFRDWDGGYGPILETIPLHPGAASAFFPWISSIEHKKRMDDYKRSSFCGVLTRDRSSGRVRIARDGSPRVVYKLNQDDERRVAEAVVLAARVLEAAGARKIFSPHNTPAVYEPGIGGGHAAWADETRRLGYRRARVTFGSWHQMGSCRMGVDPGASAIGPDNETHEVRDLFITDGSAFPTASGVNPMLTIYGIAHRAAGKIAARLS